jgi:hypothetical protein
MASFTDGDNFGVGGGIVRGGDAVGAFGEDAAFFDDDGGEWAAAAGANIFKAKRDSVAHEFCGHEE